LLTVLDAEPLEVLGGDLDHKPQLPILLALTADVAEDPGPATLRRWLRASGPHGRPIDLLLRRDFGGFEDALEDLRGRGFVLRAPGRAP
jgi:hypothetical protein